MINIEYVNGQESHSSNWGKYYVKGLETWAVKEDFEENTSTNHEQYQGYVCLDVPEGTLFTIFEQSGNKRGTDCYYFSICVATSDCNDSEDKAVYGSGFCKGNFNVVARSSTKTKSPRLMDWWISSPNKTLGYAKHCAEYIEKRGVLTPPPMS